MHSRDKVDDHYALEEVDNMPLEDSSSERDYEDTVGSTDSLDERYAVPMKMARVAA